MIKVAICQRICHHSRVPIFARLNQADDVRIKVFHSNGISGSKLENSETFDGFEHKELWTIGGSIKSSNRIVPVVIYPTIFLNLMRYEPDVILAEGGSNIFNNILVYIYAKLFRKPIIWWTLGKLNGRQFAGSGKLYRRVVIAMEKASDALLGYSSEAVRYFKKMGYPTEKSFQAFNCVDTDRVFKEIESKKKYIASLRTKLGLDGKFVVLFVGALTREKKVQRLLYSFQKVNRTNPQTHLLIVGDGVDRQRLEEIACNLGINKDVTFTGKVIDNVAMYYELGDTFVMPGLGGLAFSEAMAHGLPVICGQADGSELDYVIEGKTGFRVFERNENDMISEIAARIHCLISNPRRLANMSKQAKELIVTTYNINSYVTTIVSAIRYAYNISNN